jgi:hypothetical protein
LKQIFESKYIAGERERNEDLYNESILRIFPFLSIAGKHFWN